MTVGLRVTAPVNHQGEWKGRSPWCWGRMEAHKARSVAATSPKKPSLPSFPCPYSPGRAKHPGSRLPKCHRHPSVNPAHRAWGSCLSHSGLSHSGRRGSLSLIHLSLSQCARRKAGYGDRLQITRERGSLRPRAV